MIMPMFSYYTKSGNKSVKYISIFFLLFLLHISLFSQDESVNKGMSEINENVLKAQLEFLSSNFMEGRGIGEKGEYLAGEYISSMLKLYGIKPAGDLLTTGEEGDRSYFQNFSLIKTESAGVPELNVITEENGLSRTLKLNYNIDFIMNSTIYSEEIKAPVIFVGYGLKNEKTDHDDLSGLDLKGKFLLKLRGYPDTFEEKLTTAEISNTISQSERLMINGGALGIIEFDPAIQIVGISGKPEFLNTDYAEKQPSPYSNNARYSLPPKSMPSLFLRASVSSSIAGEILRNYGTDIRTYLNNPSTARRKSRNSYTKDTYLYIKTNVSTTRVAVRNILGMVEGKDPNSIIVVGAHYDHMGIKDGYIWNGADDNGSGTVGVMTIAKAVAATGEQPDKTIIFALWSAEEEGLLGSRYFVRNPVYPIDNIKMNINFDMISRHIDDSRPNAVTMTYNESHPIFKDYTMMNNQRYDIDLNIDYQPSANPPGGTDHRSFVEVGIPIMRFKPGHREEYHTPWDETTKTDWDIMEKIVRISFANLWDLANSDWDTESYVKPPELDPIMR